MLERFHLPENDTRLLRCKDKLYKVKLSYVRSEGQTASELPCSGDTMHKEIELAIRSLLSAAHSDVMLEKLKTQHFGIKISQRSWNLALRMTFKQHGKLLRAHSQVLVMEVSPKEFVEGDEVDKSVNVVKKGIEVVSPQMIEDELDGLQLSESDVECQNGDDDDMESDLGVPVSLTKDIPEIQSSVPGKRLLDENFQNTDDIDDNQDDINDRANFDAVKENQIPSPPIKKIKLSPVKKLKVNASPRARNGPGKYTHAKRSVRVHVEDKDDVDEGKADDEEEDDDDTIPDLDNGDSQPGDAGNEGINQTSQDLLPASTRNVKARFDALSLPKVRVNLGTRVDLDPARMQEIVVAADKRNSSAVAKRKPPKTQGRGKSLSPKKKNRTKQEADLLEEIRLRALSAPTTTMTTPEKDPSGSPLKKRVTPSRMGIMQSVIIKPVRHLFQTQTTKKK